MTSVDDLFKKPSLPLNSHKRKFETPDAHEVYKSTKLSSDSSPNRQSASGNGSFANDDDDDLEAGPALPPADDPEPDDAGDDEEGRFFGTGMTAHTTEALAYINQQDGDAGGGGGSGGEGAEFFPDERVDLPWLRRQTASLSRKATRNAELRARHEASPERFMASEAELDAEIRSWSLLAEHPALYAEFAGSEAPGLLVGLLAHENADVAIHAVQILAELVDEDTSAGDAGWASLADALLDAGLVELLRSNLARLDEEGDESDRAGVYHCLAVLENLGGDERVAERVGTREVLEWLCERIRRPEKPLGQNKQYAAEVLQVLLQSSTTVRRRLVFEVDGVDLLLQLLALYRRRDPERDSPEEEYVENLFDTLTCVVDEAEGKDKFVEAEGVELMLIMLKEGSKNTSHRAVRVLDHALGGRASAAAATACEKLIEVAGLKAIFSAFMKKADNATIEHLLGIFTALLRLLPGESAARIRTLAKFEEKDGEKVKKLVELRKDFARRVTALDREIESEQRTLSDDEIEERADEWFSRRLDGGLFCLQMTDVILAWLIAEEQSTKTLVMTLLDDGGGLQAIRDSLEEQKDGLGIGNIDDEDTRDMLDTLIGFLA